MIYDYTMVGEYKVEIITTDINGISTPGYLTFKVDQMPPVQGAPVLVPLIPTLTPEQQAIIKSKENLTKLRYGNLINKNNEFDASWPDNYNHALVDFMYTYGVRSQYTNDRQQLFNWIQQAVDGELTPDPIVIAKKNLEKIGYNPPKNEEDCYDDSWSEDGEFNSILGQYISEYGFSDEYANTPESNKRQVLFEWIQEAADNKLQKSELIEIKRKLDDLERIEGFANDRLTDQTGHYSRLWEDSGLPSLDIPIGHFLSYYGITEEYNQKTNGITDNKEIYNILVNYLNQAESGEIQPAAQATAKKNLEKLGYNVKNCSNTASGMIYDDTWPGTFDTVLAKFKEKYGLYTKYNNEPGDTRNLKLFDWIKDAVDGSLQRSKEVQIRELYDMLQNQGKVKKFTLRPNDYYSEAWDDGVTNLDDIQTEFLGKYGIGAEYEQKTAGLGDGAKDVFIDYLKKAVNGEIQPMDKNIDIEMGVSIEGTKTIVAQCSSAKSITISVRDQYGTLVDTFSREGTYISDLFDCAKPGTYTADFTVTYVDGTVKTETRNFGVAEDEEDIYKKYLNSPIIKNFISEATNTQYKDKNVDSLLNMMECGMGSLFNGEMSPYDTESERTYYAKYIWPNKFQQLMRNGAVDWKSITDSSFGALLSNNYTNCLEANDLISPNAEKMRENWANGHYVIEALSAYADILTFGDMLEFSWFLKGLVKKFGMKEALVLVRKSIIRDVVESINTIKSYLKSSMESVFEFVTETIDLGESILCKTNKLAADGSKIEVKIAKNELTEIEAKCLIDGCFTGDTLVITKEGLRRIDEIEEGELVLAKDIETGKIDYKPVITVYRKSTRKLVKLNIQGEEIKTTPNHLFFANGWWKTAEHLETGDKIVTNSGELREVISIEINELSENEKIYNLNVDEYHTYFVGVGGLLVHNDCSAAQIAVYKKQKSVIKAFTDLSESARQCLMNAAQKGWIDVTEWTGKFSGELEKCTEKEFRALDRYLRQGKDVYRIPEAKEKYIKTCDFLHVIF